MFDELSLTPEIAAAALGLSVPALEAASIKGLVALGPRRSLGGARGAALPEVEALKERLSRDPELKRQLEKEGDLLYGARSRP